MLMRLILMVVDTELEIYWWGNEYAIINMGIWDRFMVNIIIITIKMDEFGS
jgi:hypothetical protein